MKEYKVKINGNDYNVVIHDVDDTIASVEVNGTPYSVEYEKPIKKSVASKVAAAIKTPVAPASTTAPVPSTKPVSVGGTVVNSPLPGVIFELKVKEGDSVKKGQTILVLEAMKMENAIESPVDGVVKSIKVAKGDSVLEGAQLAIIG